MLIFRSILMIIMLSAGQGYAQKNSSTASFKTWYRDHLSQFERNNKKENQSYTLRFMPAEYNLMNQMNEISSKQEFKQRRQENEKYLDFMLMVESDQKQDDQLYFMLAFQNDIKLVIDQKDTLSCVEFQCDQVGNLVPHRTFKLSFNSPKSFTKMDLVIRDRSGENIIFSYTEKQIKNTPKIKWK